ncbi:hypothetical protein, variant 1 [Aphanomyces invadans]|uniref:Uncharacterized protein n=1 Tax=Aphanomyces invadans TaxID=157072 RepID=A0A024TTG3_9STRA|nr:hypothetical protein, variant 1 [Aphanomyces invadans]ETV97314.1 hypothetical protein, variant 1 [Aphanomyces invadans]|eukprot:XP_008874024.1 hypothetical protein, variant 1 [Aphanomyces invadans]
MMYDANGLLLETRCFKTKRNRRHPPRKKFPVAMASGMPDPLASLRSAIDAKLRDEGIYSQLRSLIQTHTTTVDHAIDDCPDHDDRVLHTLLESDVVQQLIASLQTPSLSVPGPSSFCTPPAATESIDEDATSGQVWPVLHVRVLGGRAFVDSLIDDTAACPTTGATVDGQTCTTSRTCLRYDVAFHGQRYQSRLVPCVVDPPFDEAMAFTLHPTTPNGGVVAKWEWLCAIEESMHWTITKHVQTRSLTTDSWQDVAVDLVAAATLDWRHWLTSPHPVVHIPLALHGPMKVPVGLVNLRLDMPSVRKSTATTHDAKTRLQKDTLTGHGTQSHLYQYCKQWWAEYVREYGASYVGKAHWIRLFVEDDTHHYKLVCTFVTPLQSIHLATPSEAARFVSLVPFVRAAHVGTGRDATWHSIPAFLALGHGDCEEHAILLASLFLGFGLKTYVCMGTLRRKPASTSSAVAPPVRHVWVATILTTGVMLWEAVTGECVAASAPACPYDRVDCIFNHKSFFANCQTTELFGEVDWNVHNSALWKGLDAALIAQVRPRQPSISLRPPNVMTAADNEKLDTALRQWLYSTRRAHGLTCTKWHPNLSHYVRIALKSYEVERVFGTANADNVFFQNCIQGAVPQGHTFKGFPVSAIGLEDLQRKLMANAVGRDVILFPRAAHALFGVAIMSMPYPEGISLIWAMVAVVYKTS